MAAVLEAARKEHEAGKGPSVGTIFVKANGEQLQHVSSWSRMAEAGWCALWALYAGWVGVEGRAAVVSMQ